MTRGVWAGATPCIPFGPQNGTKGGVAPAQTRASCPRSFSSFGALNLPPDSGVFSGMLVNGMDFFRGEHCEYSCVHPFLKLNRNLNRVLNWYFFCPFSGTDPC
jgi:hypothetical protein